MFFLISAGLFITSLGQPGVIGQLPFRFLFKNQFHLNAAQQANFFAIATFAWYLKPLAGLLCDSFPLFGTRRRSYLILAGVVAGLAWSLFAIAPRSYAAFFWLMVTLNVAMVIASTSIGGLLVEAGQEGNATGRLASVRYAIDGVIIVIAGPLGGWLAARAFGWTAGLGAMLLFLLVPVTMVLVKEPPAGASQSGGLVGGGGAVSPYLAFQNHVGSRCLAVVRVHGAGLRIAMNYYQQDVLQFSTEFIGRLQALSGIGGILATGLYAYLCRKLSLRPLLWGGILLNATSSLLVLVVPVAPKRDDYRQRQWISGDSRHSAALRSGGAGNPQRQRELRLRAFAERLQHRRVRHLLSLGLLALRASRRRVGTTTLGA
jgi:Na+/melibiose symporter-like transporter